MNTCCFIKTMSFNRPQLESFLSAHSAANQSSFRLVICRCRMAMQSVDKGRETQARRCQSFCHCPVIACTCKLKWNTWNTFRFSANLRADCAIPGAMSFHNGCTRYYCCTLRILRFELKETAAFLKMSARIGGCCKTTPLLSIIKYSAAWESLLGPIQHLSYTHNHPITHFQGVRFISCQGSMQWTCSFSRGWQLQLVLVNPVHQPFRLESPGSSSALSKPRGPLCFAAYWIGGT